MCKLSLDEWIISLVKSTYENTKGKVRVNDIFSDEFDVKVGVHHDPGHSPNKPEHVRFVRGFRKTIILKARTYVRVCSGGTLKNTI